MTLADGIDPHVHAPSSIQPDLAHAATCAAGSIAA